MRERADQREATGTLSLSLILILSLSPLLSLTLTLAPNLILKRAPTASTPAPCDHRTSATSIACTEFSRDARCVSTPSTYPSAVATSRQATVSRADPSAVR
jgi:hypothetical protein